MSKSRVLKAAVALVVAATALTACTSEGKEGEPGAEGGPAAVTGTSVLTDVLDRGVVRVAVLPDFPPASAQAADGSFEGYEPDMAHALAEALGVELEMVPTDGDTRLTLMQSGRADVNISSYTATNERAKSVAFTIPYVAQGASVVYRTENPIASYDDLADKSIAVARGSTNDTIVTTRYPDADIVRFDTIADAIAAVKAKKVDASVESFATIRLAVEKDPSLEQLDAEPLNPSLISMGILQGDPIWENYLNNFTRNYIASGENQASYKEWFGVDLPDVTYGHSPSE